MTSGMLIDSLHFDSCKGFSENQAKEWLCQYINQTSRLTEFLSFCTGYSNMPFGGLNGTISVKYLPDDDEKSLMKTSACLKILFLPTVHSSRERFFHFIDMALDNGSKGFVNS